MEPFVVVNVLDEAVKVGLRFGKGLVVVRVHLLDFQRLEEALGLRMVIRVAKG